MYLVAPFRQLGGLQRSSLRGAGRVVNGPRRYREQVLARHGNGRYTILLSPDELMAGLNGLGAGITAPQLVATGGAVAAPIAASSIVSAASLSGSWAGPIGAGIGALVGIIAGLWAAHNARAAGAKTENAALNSAVQAFDASLQALFQAANSGSVTGAQAVQVCQQILQSYWAGMAPYMSGPGRADASGGGARCATPGTLNLTTDNCARYNGSLPCNKSCTAGCCVGCNDLAPAIMAAIAVFSSPTGGSVNVCVVQGSGYGAVTRAGYMLTYTPPSPTSVAGVASSLTSSSVGGIPVWLLLAGGLGIYAATR